MTEFETDAGPMQELRQAMKGSTDPRAARTREAIIAALHELVARSEPVTVSAIVNQAHVSRSSFYAQFASVDELALAVLRDALAEISTGAQSLRQTAGVSGASAARTSVVALVSHVEAHRQLYRSVIELPMSYQVSREAVIAFELQLRDVIALVRGRRGEAEDHLIAAYLAGGTIALLSEWLRDPSLGSAEDVARQLLAFLPDWLIAP